MLQQTQVDRVIPKYRSFISRFPTIRSLARASFADVLRAWLGLGYNGRALRLWRCAQIVARDHRGRLPADLAALQRLPGIGSYTARALGALAFDAHVPAVDVNVRRVLSRSLAGCDRLEETKVMSLAHAALPRSSAGEWMQALMDVGALHCRAVPRCTGCPARAACRFAGRTAKREPAAHKPFEGSTRFYRGRIMRALSRRASLRLVDLGRQVKDGFGVSDAAWLRHLLNGLARDGLVRLDSAKDRVRLP